MSEYIEREAVKQIIAAQCGECADACLEFDGIQPDCNQCLLHGAKKTIESLPAADVRPVVKARWYWDKDGMDWGIGAWRCSACKTMSPMWWNCDRGSPMHKSGHRFCPNCGADMRGESDV